MVKNNTNILTGLLRERMNLTHFSKEAKKKTDIGILGLWSGLDVNFFLYYRRHEKTNGVHGEMREWERNTALVLSFPLLFWQSGT